MPSSLEETSAKAMGGIKGVKARVKGLSGVFKQLMEEHGQVASLMTRVSRSSDEAVRRDLYPTIRKELLSHEKGELTAVYPVLRQHAETSEIAETHAREASELDAAIKAVDALDFSGEEWAPAFEYLFGLVKKHVAEEEGEFFPTAQETLGDEVAAALEKRYLAAKESALEEVS